MNCAICGQVVADGRSYCQACEREVLPKGAEVMIDEEVSIRPILVGDVLVDQWKIEKKIGQGGMAAVFLARDLKSHRKVALKALRGVYCADPIFVARFEREARITASLNHPNIVPVYSVGNVNGRPFMVMKALEGITLSGEIAERKAQGRLLESNEVLWLMKELCAGLAYIHAKGFVHRDIKTSNLFIETNGHLTVLDLGVLRDVRAPRGLTRTGALVGTPDYMAPEQAVSGAPVDHRADLYAAGIVLFKCLTGEPPFQADSDRALLDLQLTAEPPDVCELVPDLPRAVSAVVRRALEKRPEDRFQSPQEMYQALEASYARTAPPEAPGLSTGTVVNTIPAWTGSRLEAPEIEPNVPTQVAHPVTRRQGLWLLAGIALGGVVASGAYLLTLARRRSSRPAQPSVLTAPPPPPAGATGRLRVITTRDGQAYWAVVHVNGIERGETPIEVELPVGMHLLRIERSGFKPIEKEVRIGPGERPEVRFELVP
jgi:eukaryotic-like serine/threonine-protein kinase